jgi:hypothetical protein
MFLTDKIFWSDASERSIKTAAQTLITLWLAGDSAFNILVINWNQALGLAGGAALLSILSSIASAQVRDRGTASLTVNPPVSDAEGIGK